jgi:hypothetical protein
MSEAILRFILPLQDEKEVMPDLAIHEGNLAKRSIDDWN